MPLDGLLLHANMLCTLSYEAPVPYQAPKEEEPGEAAARAHHTGVFGQHRSLRPCPLESPDRPPVRPQESTRGQSECPSGDRSGDWPESPACATTGMSRPFGPGPCNPQIRPNFQFYPQTTHVYVAG